MADLTDGNGGGKEQGPPGYTLLANLPTVQVLSPTFVTEVQQATIQTHGHGVIAGYPVPQKEFETLAGRVTLGRFAGGIEQIMALPYVIAGTGNQTLDASGLTADNVTFTVEYVPPDATTETSITGDAVVPVALLANSDPKAGSPGIAEAKAIIDAVYADLQSLAGG